MTTRQVDELSVQRAESAFRRSHPQYADTDALDQLRRSDYARIDRDGHVYLDYTGGGLFASSQLNEHVALLERDVYGNPHSINSTSAASTELVERARAAVLEFFNASADEYVAIFTPNATGALRLVGEAYPFRPGDRFLLTFDNHNSVNGIREFARARGAETTYIPSVPPDLRVDERLFPRYLTDTVGEHHNLFAYPRSPTFPASSIRWSGSSRRMRTAGTCCSTPPPTSQPTGSTSARGIRTLWRCRSTRCSGGRRESGACLRVATRSQSSSAHGLRLSQRHRSGF